jgi:hypothetical protein
MKRIHLFEFEDQSWFPAILRDYGTDFLQFLSNRTYLFKPIIPVLKNILAKTDPKCIVDLASGGGGGLLRLNEELKKVFPGLRIILTDYYPNIRAFEYTSSQSDNFKFIRTSIDARKVPSELKGIRTQFLSLHHFKPHDAVQILQNAVDSGSPILIVEGQERSLPSILAMIFSPISVLITTPFIRPFRWGRLLFTYLIPVVPIFVMWDGVVSSLRTYSVEEMKGLISHVNGHEKFRWETARLKSGPGVNLYLLGMPLDKEKPNITEHD